MKRGHFLALYTSFLVSLVMCSAGFSHALTIDCQEAPQYRESYPNDEVWPFVLATNIPSNSWYRSTINDSIAMWNQITGARANLSISGDGYQQCHPPFNAGFGLMAFDDGTCLPESSDFAGVVLKWTSNCVVTRSLLYLNIDIPWTRETFQETVVHELGHYMYYAHVWDRVSVMGYPFQIWGTMEYLNAIDHYFLRGVFPQGNAGAENLYLSRHVLLPALGRDIVPDQHSYTQAPEPTCSSVRGCQHLWPGSEISVILTYGNAGARDATGPVDIAMHLGSHEIGRWTVQDGLPAHTDWSAEFTAEVPDTIEPGSHDLWITIDPDGKYRAGVFPSASETVRFPGMGVDCGRMCANNPCADDGCGRPCGTCADNETCTITGEYQHQSRTRYTSQCVCEPDCRQKSCGESDGCGGTCGECDTNTQNEDPENHGDNSTPTLDRETGDEEHLVIVFESEMPPNNSSCATLPPTSPLRTGVWALIASFALVIWSRRRG